MPNTEYPEQLFPFLALVQRMHRGRDYDGLSIADLTDEQGILWDLGHHNGLICIYNLDNADGSCGPSRASLTTKGDDVLKRYRLRKATDLIQTGGQPANVTAKADVPDATGYVAAPVDPTAYVPASVVVAEHAEGLNIPTVRELGRLLERFGETKVRWTRPRTASGEPDKRRRLVHLGDWLTYAKARGGADAEQAGIEARKAAIRAAKHG